MNRKTSGSLNSNVLQSRVLVDHRGSYYHADYDPEKDLDIDENTLLGGENEIVEVLDLLGQQHGLRLTKEQKAALQDSKLKTFDKAFTQFNLSMVEADKELFEEEDEGIIDFDENPTLIKAWKRRQPCYNWTLTIGFHVVVITNFIFCLWESFSNISESAMYDLMYLRDSFQCLNLAPNQRSLAHMANIIHALTCVTVLHAKSRETAHLCWAFLIGTTIHACFKVYELFYGERFTFDEPRRYFQHWGQIQLILVLLAQFIAILLIIQRYYDLTANFQKRAKQFSTQTYEGRHLNDKIAYKNLSSFVQRKNILRSCTALQIYSTVKTLQNQKYKLKKGEELDEYVFNKEVTEAVNMLKDVEQIKGKEMLKELKRRHYRKAQQEDLLEDDKDQTFDGKVGDERDREELFFDEEEVDIRLENEKGQRVTDIKRPSESSKGPLETRRISAGVGKLKQTEKSRFSIPP